MIYTFSRFGFPAKDLMHDHPLLLGDSPENTKNWHSTFHLQIVQLQNSTDLLCFVVIVCIKYVINWKIIYLKCCNIIWGFNIFNFTSTLIIFIIHK